MKRCFAVWTIMVAATLYLCGCNGSSTSETVSLSDLTGGGTGGTGGTQTTRPTGTLGTLKDLGDLVQRDLPQPTGDHWYYTKAKVINDSGVIVGQSNTDGITTKGAFRWQPPAGPMTFLGIHEDASGFRETYDDYFDIFYERADPRKYFIYSEAVDVNNSGVIIGNSTTGVGWPNDTEKRAFEWKDGRFVDLAPHPFFVSNICNPGFNDRRVIGSYSEAVDINDKGEVVLTLEDVPGEKHAYYWDGTSFQTITLDRQPGALDPCPLVPIQVDVPIVKPLCSIVGEDSFAVAINENGQAVINSGGTALFYDLNWHVCESLNSLPGATMTAAVDINDSKYTNNDGIPDGHIIGNSGTDKNSDGKLRIGDDTFQGFFWDGGAMYPVDHLGGGTSQATDINNSDQVVGAATKPDGTFHAILWTLGADKKGHIQDLGTLGGANSFATAINEAGQVVGWSETGDSYTEQGITPVPVRHAFLWNNGVMYDLGVHNDFYNYSFIEPYPFSEGVDINASGQVTGNSITINSHYRGFFLSPVFP